MDTDYKFGEGKFRWIINESFVEHGSSLKQVGRREQLDWIKREIEYSMFAEKFKLRYELLKGEVYEIDFGININAEFSNRHFGVVIKNSNENNPLVLVCPLKTNHRGAHPRSDVDIGFIKDIGATHTSLAVINQIRPIDKLRIYTSRAIGYSNEELLAEGEKSRFEKPIIRLTDEQMNLILNAYCNYVFNETP